MSTLRHVTYNLLNYTHTDREIRERMKTVRETLNSTGADVVSAQEFYGANWRERAAIFGMLADDLGLGAPIRVIPQRRDS